MPAEKTIVERVDVNRADTLTPEIDAAIVEMFEYQAWTPEQVRAGKEIRNALVEAVRLIVMFAPPCPDRSVAIRKLREARMDANSAITHRGKY